VRLRNVSRKSARFRISSTRTSDITSTATAVSSGSGGVRAVYKPRGPVPAGLTCDVAVELTPGQFEVFFKKYYNNQYMTAECTPQPHWLKNYKLACNSVE
jgi:hypothetical protein